MLGVILPVKPEIDWDLRTVILSALRLHQFKRQTFAAGFKMEQKILPGTEIFCGVEIRVPIVDDPTTGKEWGGFRTTRAESTSTAPESIQENLDRRR